MLNEEKAKMLTVHPKLEEVFKLLGKNWCPNVYVAGGAAVDFEKASDVDLWFPEAGFQAAKNFAIDLMLVNHVVTFFDAYFEATVEDAFEKSTSEDYTGNISAGPKRSVIIANAYLTNLDVLLQILVTKAKDSMALVSNFDISTHQAAIHTDGKVVVAKTFTLPSEQPVVLEKANNTLARYVKICRRYGHPITAKGFDY